MLRVTVHSPLEILAKIGPDAARMLEWLGAGAHEQTKTLVEFCRENALDSGAVLEVLLHPAPAPPTESVDWSVEPLARLVDHIVAWHHGFVRRQLPRLQLLLDATRGSRKGRLPELEAIRAAFALLRRDLEEHLLTEEEVLFPLVRGLDHIRAHPGCSMGSVDQPVAKMVNHFGEVGLGRLRSLTDAFQPPGGRPLAYQAFVDELALLERDLERHAQLENGFLFPRAVVVERMLTRS